MSNWIDFKKERDFNALISHTIDFIKQEFKPLGKVILTYAGPFVLITAFLSAMFQSSLYSNMDVLAQKDIFAMYRNVFGAKYFFFVLSSILSNAVLITVINSYIYLYVTKGKDGFAHEEVWQMLGQKIIPVILGFIALSFILAIGFLLLIIPGIYMAIAFSMVFYIMFYENTGFSNALSRSMELVKGRWWFTLGVLIVATLIAYFSAYIFMIPQFILSFMYTFSLAKGTFEGPSLLYTIFTVIGTFISGLLYALPYITIAFLYHSLLEKKEKPGLIDKIDEIK